jgi:hypothetical protein
MWTGLAVCVLLLIVDVASVWWDASWTSQPQDRNVSVHHGQIELWTGGGVLRFPANPGWWVFCLRTPSIRWWPTIQTVPNPPVGPVISVGIPLWIPLVVVAIPTGFLWRRNRRPPPGHCPRCRYNLTGNVSGVCPECGRKV